MQYTTAANMDKQQTRPSNNCTKVFLLKLLWGQNNIPGSILGILLIAWAYSIENRQNCVAALNGSFICKVAIPLQNVEHLHLILLQAKKKRYNIVTSHMNSNTC